MSKTKQDNILAYCNGVELVQDKTGIYLKYQDGMIKLSQVTLEGIYRVLETYKARSYIYEQE